MQVQIGRKTRSRGRISVPGSKHRGATRKLQVPGIAFVHERRPDANGNLTAAALEVKADRPGAYRRLHQPWQDEALANYDAFGACRYPATFYSDTFSQIRLFPARRNPRGTPQEIDDPAAVEALSRVRDKSGGHSHILRSYGKLQFLVGDGYLTVTGTSDRDDPEIWEYLSPQELRIDASGNFIRVRGTMASDEEALVNGSGELRAGQIKAWRMWRPHPAHSLLADAPMKSVASLFEELGLLQAAVRARVKSRLAAAGILMLPDDISFPDEANTGDEDGERDIFIDKLIEHLTMPIENEGTASAVTPFVLRADEDAIAAIRHLKLHDPNETYRETGLRLETIKQISVGLDIPPEILLGLADSNHWTAWQVDEQVAKAHIYPLATMFCDDLTSAYFRPTLRDAKVPGWQDMTVWYDATPIVVHPNRAQDAKDLHKEGVLSGDALLFHCGFADTEKMGEEEHREWLATKLRDPNLLSDDPSVARDQSSRTGEDVDTDAPSTQPQFQMLIGAAEFAIDRARSLAGARAVRIVQSCADCMQQIDGVPKHLISSVLAGHLQGEGVEARKLVDGTAAEVFRTAVRLGLSETSARALGERVEAYAARTLFEAEPAPLPPGFHQFIGQL